MGQPKYRFAMETVLNAIYGSQGNYSIIAQRLGCHRDTAEKYVLKWEKTKTARQQEVEHLKDFTESKLTEMIRNGERWAIKFYLSTVAKDRGFTTKTEFAGEFDGKIDFNLYRH